MARMTLADVRALEISDKLAHDNGVYLDARGVCERYDVDRGLWLDWCRAGLVPAPVKVGGQFVRWSVYDLLVWEWTRSVGEDAWDKYLDLIEPVDVTAL